MSDPAIVIVLAHPKREMSRVGQALARTAAAQPNVQLRDLYALYPDYFIDVAAEQAALEPAQLVVWLHPIQWYGMPALMKLWVDEVFTYGWAYGTGAALAGKDLWLVTSTGGSADSYHPSRYNRYFFDAFMPPYDQTAALAGMRFIPPLVQHGAHRASDAELAAQARLFGERLATYPHWPELDALEPCLMPQVPASARPIENP